MANPNPDTADSNLWRSEPGPWRRADVLAILAWTGAVLLYFWDVATLRGALFYFDISEINYPYRDFLARELASGRFARWFPGLYCGMPLYSESQAGYLHPLKFVLYPWMATWKALNLDTVLSVWLTGIGTYGWLRRHVGPAGALTGASVFGLSGFVWAHLIHTSMNNALSSVPFAVWALEWAWTRRRLAGVVLGAFALAFQVFAGHLQDTLLTAGLLATYGLFRAITATSWAERRSVLARTVALIALGVGLAAVQWIPSKELLDRSPRAGGLTWDDLTYGSWHPELLPTLVVREAYGTRARDTDWMDGFYPYHEMNAYLGLTAMALAVLGAAAGRDRWVAFWVVLATVASLLMLGRFTLLMDQAHRIPILGSSRIPVRFHLWVSLATAALAGVGVDRLSRGGPVRLRVAFGLGAFLAAVSVPILATVYMPALVQPERWNLPYHVARYGWLRRELVVGLIRTALVAAAGATALVVAVRTRTPWVRTLATASLPLVVIADLLGAHWYDVPTVPPTYWTVPPPTVARLKADPSLIRIFGVAERSAGEPGYASEPIDFLAVRDPLDWSLAPVWGLASSNGVTPIIPRRMVEYTDHVLPGAGRFELESVSHVLTGRRANTIYGSGVEVGTAKIHRVDRVQPRARLAGRPLYVAGEAEAMQALDDLGAAVRDRLVVEDPDRPLPETAVASGTARIVVDDPEHVAVATESAGPSYLVLADTFDPGWSAAVDGRSAPIRPAWLTFRAVFLPPGPHRVDFHYRPAGFTAGLAVSLTALGLAAALLTLPRRHVEPSPDHRALARPKRGFTAMAGLVALILAASVVRVDGAGHAGVQSRWRKSFHHFTWGAGVEAIKPKPR